MVTHRIKLLSRKSLSKEVSEVVVSVDIGHTDLHLFHHLAHKEVATIDVFSALVKLRVVTQVAGRLVVHTEVAGSR